MELDRAFEYNTAGVTPAAHTYSTLVDAEPVDGDLGDEEPIDAEPVDAEPIDADPGDAEQVDADPGDAEPVDEEPGLRRLEDFLWNSDWRLLSSGAGACNELPRRAARVELGCRTRSRRTCDKGIKLGRKGSELTRRATISLLVQSSDPASRAPWSLFELVGPSRREKAQLIWQNPQLISQTRLTIESLLRTFPFFGLPVNPNRPELTE
jgi:hypothetical protein